MKPPPCNENNIYRRVKKLEQYIERFMKALEDYDPDAYKALSKKMSEDG
jgi:hypothetical protein